MWRGSHWPHGYSHKCNVLDSVFFFSVNFIKVQMHVAAQILAFFLCAFVISHHFPCFLATLSDLLNNLMYHFTDI